MQYIKIYIVVFFVCLTNYAFSQNAFIYNVSNTKIIVPNISELYKVDESISKFYKTNNTENIVTFTFEKDIFENHIILYSTYRSSEFKSSSNTFLNFKNAYKNRELNIFIKSSNEDLIPYFVKVKDLIKIFYEGKDSLLLENANLILNQIIEGKVKVKDKLKNSKVNIIYDTDNAILYEITNGFEIGDLDFQFTQYIGNVFINNHIFGISAINNTDKELGYKNGRNRIIQFIKGIEVLNN
jgi:hypothetical protein